MVGRLMFTQSVYVSDKNEDFIKSFIIIVKFSIAYRIKYWFDAPIDNIKIMIGRVMFTQSVFFSNKNKDF